MLKLLGNGQEKPFVPPCEALKDHMKLLEGYFLSYKVRNLAESTLKKEKAFLTAWFETHSFGDFQDYRPLYTWEAMDHLNGRRFIVNYGKTLVEAEMTSETVRSYLGILRRYFSFILEHPVLFTSETEGVRIQEKYGIILVQPVSEFDMPHYVYGGERLGVPMDPEKLYGFYSLLREVYCTRSPHTIIKQRNYAMAVVAGETGLRVDELLSLEISKDIFFDSKKIQTRHAKAAKGSGKRCRQTLFPPLARDTLRFYIEKVRPEFTKPDNDLLFPSKTGGKLSYTNAYLALRDMIEDAKKKGFPVQNHMGWHWFRRIFATRFIEKFPAKLSILIELLGHMSPNTVHRYIRHSEAWMDKEIQDTLLKVDTWLSVGD